MKINYGKKINQIPKVPGIFTGIDKLITSIVFDTKRTKSQRISLYLRLYTDFVSSLANFNGKDYAAFLNEVKRARKFAGHCDFKDEKPYVQKIKDLIDELMPHLKLAILEDSDQCMQCEHKIKTNIRTAQGICVFRILAIGG